MLGRETPAMPRNETVLGWAKDGTTGLLKAPFNAELALLSFFKRSARSSSTILDLDSSLQTLTGGFGVLKAKTLERNSAFLGGKIIQTLSVCDSSRPWRESERQQENAKPPRLGCGRIGCHGSVRRAAAQRIAAAYRGAPESRQAGEYCGELSARWASRGFDALCCPSRNLTFLTAVSRRLRCPGRALSLATR